MNLFKKIALFVAATIIAVYLVIWSLDTFGFRSPIFAFLVNWLAMSWVAIAGQAVNFYFPAWYYKIRAFEQAGQVYECLGIRLFKSLVRRGPFSIFSPTLRLPKENSVSALLHLEGEMSKAETGHVLIFILMLVFTGYALFRGWLDSVAWLLAFNVIFNVYPIMLQRYNRIKLQALIQMRAV